MLHKWRAPAIEVAIILLAGGLALTGAVTGVTASDVTGVTASDVTGVTASDVTGVTASDVTGVAASDVPGPAQAVWADQGAPVTVTAPSSEATTSLAPDPFTAALIDQVDAATLYQYEAWLTGVQTATIGGAPYLIATRHTASGTPIEKATQFAYEHMTALGLDVTYHAWTSGSYTGRNVIGEMDGLTNPDTLLILSAHLDDMPAGTTAPGADDNASGSAAVLVAADILSQYDSSCTLEFALWTGEEQGLLGSRAWAAEARSQGLDIAGVLNLDMIAYDSDATPGIDLHARSTLAGSVEMANLFAGVVETYDLDLVPEILIDDSTGSRSDNQSFWYQGYDAILAIEDNDDFNPNYHTTRDQLSTLNLPFLTEFVKASVGALANLADCTIFPRTGLLTGQVTDADYGQPIANAVVHMAGPDGAQFEASVGASGSYSQILPPGTYTVTAEAAGYRPAVASGVVVTAGEATTQNLVLGPLPCILLVDDDDNAPDVRPYYTIALDELGYGYDVFETGDGDGPGVAGLQGYKMVIWFSGARSGATAGPSTRDETSLSTYLDGGGHLFLSSQDYVDARKVTPFGTAYLGIEGYSANGGAAQTLYAVPGDPIGQGLGPYPLAYPAGFDDRSDGLSVASGASVAFQSDPAGGTPLVLDRDGGPWSTVFFGTSWVGIAHQNATNGAAMLHRTIEWSGDCTCQTVEIVDTTVALDGCTATLGARVAGTAPFAYEWDLGAFGSSPAAEAVVAYGSSGTYPYTLTVSNCGGAGSDVVAGEVAVACGRWQWYLPAIRQGE